MSRRLTQTIRVLLVEDHEVVREGLRALLERDPGISVIGDVGTASAAIQAARELSPHVVVMDVRLPDNSGITACRTIREHHPAVRIIFLSSFTDDIAVTETILGGADGYLLKRVNATGLTRAVHTVAAGQTILDPAVKDAVVTRTDRPGHEGGRLLAKRYRLSPQQTRVLALVAEGKTNKEISQTLNLSEKTVKNYVRFIFHKLDFTRRSQAAAYFARMSSN
ncbi:response regulator transcription factor [Nitrospira sp. Nam80]